MNRVVQNWVNIDSDNGLSSIRRQAIMLTNAGLLSIGHLGNNFRAIFIRIKTFHSWKCIWKYRLRNGGHFVHRDKHGTSVLALPKTQQSNPGEFDLATLIIHEAVATHTCGPVVIMVAITNVTHARYISTAYKFPHCGTLTRKIYHHHVGITTYLEA